MEFSSEKINGILFLKLSGRIDGSGAGGFQEEILEAIGNKADKVAFDMEAIDYINSSGLRVFLSLAKSVNRLNGRMVLFGLKEHIREVFDMTGLLSVIKAVGSKQDAEKEMS